MNVYHSIQNFKPTTNLILTLGMYDGVHVGHQSIINQLNTIAKEVGGESALLTFDPHPRMVLQADCDLKFLTPLDEKEEKLAEMGLNNLIIHPFTKAFSQLSSVDFVKQLLVDELQIHTLVIGYDHHFGKNREGNFEQLQELSLIHGFNLVQIAAVEEGDLAVSSTKIRKAISAGDMTYANRALNYKYRLSGQVVHGDKIGRTLGFPTANLHVNELKLLPKDGVYAVEVLVDRQNYLGLLSMGYRQTITHAKEHRIEVHILEFDGQIYDQTISLNFLAHIREEQKFSSLEALMDAMQADKRWAIAKFG